MSRFYYEKKITKKVFDIEALETHINTYLLANKVGKGIDSRELICVYIDEWEEEEEHDAHLCIHLEYSDEDEDDYMKVNGDLPCCDKFDSFLSDLSKELGIEVALPFDYR